MELLTRMLKYYAHIMILICILVCIRSNDWFAAQFQCRTKIDSIMDSWSIIKLLLARPQFIFLLVEYVYLKGNMEVLLLKIISAQSGQIIV